MFIRSPRSRNSLSRAASTSAKPSSPHRPSPTAGSTSVASSICSSSARKNRRRSCQLRQSRGSRQLRLRRPGSQAMGHRETITRGNLPHWFVPGAAHFVTYRLVETIPLLVIEHLQAKKAQLLRERSSEGSSPALRRWHAHKALFAEYDRYLDSHRNIDWLA